MKKALLILLLLSPMALRAQQDGSDDTPAGTVVTSLNFPTERVVTPTNSDLYCAGFVSKPIHANHQFVTGGMESPFTTRFATHDLFF